MFINIQHLKNSINAKHRAGTGLDILGIGPQWALHVGLGSGSGSGLRILEFRAQNYHLISHFSGIEPSRGC